MESPNLAHESIESPSAPLGATSRRARSSRAFDPTVAADDEPRQAQRVKSSLDWRTLLSGASPREVLARLMAKDVLELRRRIAELLAERCYLLDADAVFLRAVARVARFSTRYRGDPPLDAWLRGQLDDAIGDCLERAHEAPTNTVDVDAPASAFTELARPLGLDPTRMRAVCATFNALPLDERAAFFALVLDQQPLEASAASGGRAPTEWARCARRALQRCIGVAIASDVSDPAESPSTRKAGDAATPSNETAGHEH